MIDAVRSFIRSATVLELLFCLLLPFLALSSSFLPLLAILCASQAVLFLFLSPQAVHVLKQLRSIYKKE